jgi:phage terminase large subunit-like protein
MRGPSFLVNWHIDRLTSKIQSWMTTPNGRMMVFAPPRHGKSEVVSRLLPAWLLGRNPDCHVMAGTHTHNLSTDLCLDVQEIMDDPRYQEVFPGVRLKRVRGGDDADKAATRLANEFTVVGRRGRYEATSVNAAIVGKGYDFGILDDPVAGAAEASSPIERARLARWFATSFATRAAPNAPILLMHQRWNLNDLAGSLLAAASNANADQWDFLSFPAILEKPTAGDPRQVGEALWPERYPLEYLLSRKAANTPSDWLAIYQQMPIQEGGALFREDWFRNYWGRSGDMFLVGNAAYSREDLLVFLIGDPSLGKKDGDRTGVVVAALTPCQKLLILEACGERWAVDVMPKEILRLCLKHGCGFVGFEADGMQDRFVEALRDTPGMPIVRELSHQGRDKKARAAAAIILASQGRILLPADPDWDTAPYLQEMISFTGADGNPDDMVDATVYASTIVGRIHGDDGPSEVESESTPYSRRSGSEPRLWGRQ